MSASSLLKKPLNGTSPARDAAPMVNVTAVIGMARHSPPISRMSVLPVPWVTLPAPRKSSALETPWTSRWSMAAAIPNAPRDSIIRPRWLMVE